MEPTFWLLYLTLCRAELPRCIPWESSLQYPSMELCLAVGSETAHLAELPGKKIALITCCDNTKKKCKDKLIKFKGKKNETSSF